MSTLVAGKDNIVAGEDNIVVGEGSLVGYILAVEQDIALLDLIDVVGDMEEQMDTHSV